MTDEELKEELHWKIYGKKEGKIHYLEFKGELCFAFRTEEPSKTHDRSKNVYESYGIVPKKIVKRGRKEIKKYAENKVRNEVQVQKSETKKINSSYLNSNFFISADYGGVRLQGKIISAKNDDLTVRLKSPYTGEQHIHFGWASAMAGRYIFNKSGSFSEEAIQRAKELLISIYKEKEHEEKNRKIISLAKKLEQD